jgi:hypothetical protein
MFRFIFESYINDAGEKQTFRESFKKLDMLEKRLFPALIILLLFAAVFFLLYNLYDCNILFIIAGTIGLVCIAVFVILVIYQTKENKKGLSDKIPNYEKDKIVPLVYTLIDNKIDNPAGIDWLIKSCEEHINNNVYSRMRNFTKSFAVTFLFPAIAFFAGVILKSSDVGVDALLVILFSYVYILLFFYAIGFFCFTIYDQKLSKYRMFISDLLYLKDESKFEYYKVTYTQTIPKNN